MVWGQIHSSMSLGMAHRLGFFFLFIIKGFRKKQKQKKYATLKFQMFTLNLALIYGLDP